MRSSLFKGLKCNYEMAFTLGPTDQTLPLGSEHLNARIPKRHSFGDCGIKTTVSIFIYQKISLRHALKTGEKSL